MTTPQNPEDEPVGDELPDELPDEPPPTKPDRVPGGISEGVVPDPLAAEEALWRSIVDNYGDRPEIAEPEPAPEPPPATRDPGIPPHPDDIDDAGSTAVATDPEDHFVPPPPPPLPTPPPARLLAWVGLFGVPMFVLVALVADLALPTLLGLLLMIWFVGGFVFLVGSMRPGPGEDHDDGARL